MTALAALDLVLVSLAVVGAAGYMAWKVGIRSRPSRSPPVRVGGTLARGLERARQERRRG